MITDVETDGLGNALQPNKHEFIWRACGHNTV